MDISYQLAEASSGKRNVVRPHTLKAWSLAAAKGESTSLCHGPACHGEQKPTLWHCDQSGVSAVRVAAAQACCYFCVELGQGSLVREDKGHGGGGRRGT